MGKELSLLDRIYFDPVYTDVCRLIGYKGCAYRELWDRLKPATTKYGQQKVETATAHLLTYDGQFTCNPPPLAQVKLCEQVRGYCWQLLGPPPEKEDAFWRNPDGTPMDRTKEAKEPAAANPAPKKRTRKKAT